MVVKKSHKRNPRRAAKVTSKKINSSSPSKWRVAPLKGSFLVFAMFGFLFSAYFIYPKSFNFGVASMLIFVAMFIASLISMTKAPVMKEE